VKILSGETKQERSHMGPEKLVNGGGIVTGGDLTTGGVKSSSRSMLWGGENADRTKRPLGGPAVRPDDK